MAPLKGKLGAQVGWRPWPGSGVLGGGHSRGRLGPWHRAGERRMRWGRRAPGWDWGAPETLPESQLGQGVRGAGTHGGRWNHKRYSGAHDHTGFELGGVASSQLHGKERGRDRTGEGSCRVPSPPRGPAQSCQGPFLCPRPARPAPHTCCSGPAGASSSFLPESTVSQGRDIPTGARPLSCPRPHLPVPHPVCEFFFF